MKHLKHPDPAPHTGHARWRWCGLALVAATWLVPWAVQAQVQETCDEGPGMSVTASASEGVGQLRTLARDAVAQSADVLSAEHGRSAAQFELKQTAAAKKPNLNLGASAGVAQSDTEGYPRSSESRTTNLSLNLGAPLYDGGRIEAMTNYRARLLDAGDVGLVAARERAVRDAVLTALDRNRYRMQLAVYEQYVGKMGCLVKMMEQVVQLDRGRTSELVQARKGLLQARLSRDDTFNTLRQTEVRLGQLIGPQHGLAWDAASAPLQDVPELSRLLDEINDNPDVQQLRLQADALDHYVRASKADLAPQVRWQVGAASGHQSRVGMSNWNAGVLLNLTLADGGAAEAGSQAAYERAQAARRQLDAVVQDRVRQVTSLHDGARSALSRAEQVGEVLRDSDQVRKATYEQWARLGRRSLFDLISAEADYYQLRLAQVNAQHDVYSAVAQLRSGGQGLVQWLAPDLAATAPGQSSVRPPALVNPALPR